MRVSTIQEEEQARLNKEYNKVMAEREDILLAEQLANRKKISASNPHVFPRTIIHVGLVNRYKQKNYN